jgi:cell surface protein SprA
VPLKVTPPGNYSPASDTIVWPTQNNLDFDIQTLINLKLQRNNSVASVSTIYRQVIGNKTFSVLGNPNIGAVNAFLIGVESAITNTTPLSAEVWVDELRLSNFNETGAYAATGRVDIGLALLGKMSI